VDKTDLMIREYREQSGLTLTSLAAKAGISAAQLSQVERGRADASLATLRRIAAALEVPLFSLFNAGDEAKPFNVQKNSEHLRISLPGSDTGYSRLSSGRGKLEVLRADLRPGIASSSVFHSHGAEECVYVEKGTVTLETPQEILQLDEGSSCHFSAEIPHRYVNNTNNTAIYIVAVTPPSF
jgi:transcriptional regulator with XRE-family HTH domain